MILIYTEKVGQWEGQPEQVLKINLHVVNSGFFIASWKRCKQMLLLCV